MNLDESPILELLKARNLQLPAEVLELFNWGLVCDYYRFLCSENVRGGFFSKKDSERILERHVYECLILVYYVSKHVGVSRETSIADIGSGPGLPGFLFACFKNPSYVTLIDSSKRRLGLLEEFARGHGMTRIKYIYNRAEEVRAEFDLVTIRALIPFPHCLEVSCQLVRAGGYAAYFASEKMQISEKSAVLLDSLGFISRETLDLDHTMLENRKIILLQKKNVTRKGYPRNWKIIKNEIAAWEK